jgi:hypothetical protein
VDASLPTMMLVQFSAYPGPSGSISLFDCALVRKGKNASRRVMLVLTSVFAVFFFMNCYFVSKLPTVKYFMLSNIIFVTDNWQPIKPAVSFVIYQNVFNFRKELKS